jgi:hypothetical protein
VQSLRVPLPLGNGASSQEKSARPVSMDLWSFSNPMPLDAIKEN